jgi:probable F420-dependent oxidoreductase
MERLGVSVPFEGSLAELPALARRAEALGYTDAWSQESNALDGFTPLAVMAAVTERMRLGTAVIPAFTRPPGLLAMHAAALAELAPGRVVLGLGASTQVVVEKWLGVPFSKPLARTREAAAAVSALLRGERVGGMKLARPPASPPPIFLAALGPKMLRSGGEVAEGVVFFLTGPRIIPSMLADIGRDVESVARILVFPGRSPEVMANARRTIMPYTLVPYYARSLERQGFGEEVRAVQRAWSDGDRAGAPGQVSDAMLRELVLLGTDDDIAEGLAAYRRAGLTTPVLGIWSGDPTPVLEAMAPARC